jgi:hypothetical protein
LCPPCRRARKRAIYDRERADPQRLQLRREYFRIYQYDLRRAAGAPVRGPFRLRTRTGYADSPQPFGGRSLAPDDLAAHVRQWIAAYDATHLEGSGWVSNGGGRAALAQLAGVPERRIWGVLHGRRVHVVTADRIACAIGLPLGTIVGAT